MSREDHTASNSDARKIAEEKARSTTPAAVAVVDEPVQLDAPEVVEALAEAEWNWYWTHATKGGLDDIAWSEVDPGAAEGWRARARHMLDVIATTINGQP